MARKTKLLPTETGSSNGLGYQQCHWNSDGERCRYPGSLSNTAYGDPKDTVWHCSLHFDCGDAFEGAAIVSASRDYQHQTFEQKQAEHRATAIAYCDALGLKTIDEKRAYFRAMVRSLARNMRPAYFDEQNPEPGRAAGRAALGGQEPIRLEREPGEDWEEPRPEDQA